MARRAYTSEVRARAARETRAAILRAAGELFGELGYARTGVAAVAERAGVALNTVYTSVGGKPALIEALARDGMADESIEAALAEIDTLTDGRRILRLLAANTGETTRRYADLLRLLLDNRTSEPVVAAAAEEAVRRYRERLRRVADRLVAVGATANSPDRTAAILWFYFGTGAWTTVREMGWTYDEGATWLGDQAIAALIGS